MENIPTAEEMVKKWDNEGFLEDRFVEFAKLHVQAALKAQAKLTKKYVINKSPVPSTKILINAYPLTNIK